MENKDFFKYIKFTFCHTSVVLGINFNSKREFEEARIVNSKASELS